MKHIVDLHGLTYKQATAKVETVLINASFNKAMVATIITGKSKAMQDVIINEVLIPYNFNYFISENNSGVIIVCENTL